MERSYQGVDEYRKKNSDRVGHFWGFSEPIHIHYDTDFAKTDSETEILLNDEGLPAKSLEEVESYTYTWASYRLSQMPGCCGLAVSYNAQVREEMKGYGLGEFFHKERLKLIKDSGYSAAICTVTSENVTQKNLLSKNGWHMVHSFVNRRTKNTVEIWVKDID